MSSTSTFEPYALRPTNEELGKAKTTTVRIPIAGDTAFHLRNLAARMGIMHRISYDTIIRCLLLSARTGAPLGKLREHPEYVALVNPPKEQ